MVRRRFHRAAIAAVLAIGLAGAVGVPASADDGPSLPVPDIEAVTQTGSDGDEPEIDRQGLCVDVDLDPGAPCASDAAGNESLNICIRADDGVVSELGRTTGITEQSGLACSKAASGPNPAPENDGGNPAPQNPGQEQSGTGGGSGASPEPVEMAEPAEAVVQQPSFTG